MGRGRGELLRPVIIFKLRLDINSQIHLYIYQPILIYIGWINSKVLLYSTGNYIQYLVINHNGKEYEKEYRDLPGGPMVKTPSSKAGDAGSIPGRGTKIPHATGQLSPQLLSLHTSTREPACHNYRAHALWSLRSGAHALEPMREAHTPK